MADSKKTKGIDFEKELAYNVYLVNTGKYEIDAEIHRRRSGNYRNARAFATSYCNDESSDLFFVYKKGTQYSDICKECLKSYSMEEIKLLKHFLIVQKLKGK